MMNTVRHSFHSIGDRSGDLARSVGSGTVDFARRIGDGTVTVVKEIGPRRALIGLAVAAVAIGGAVLIMRYLRTRRADSGFDVENDDLGRPTHSAPTVAGSDARVSG